MRIVVAAQAVGIARAAFETALVYVRDRTQFERPIVVPECRQHARGYAYAHQRRPPADDPSRGAIAHRQLFASEITEWVCSKAIQIHGGYGYLKDYSVERHYRNARITQLYEVTSEILRMLITRSMQLRRSRARSCAAI